MERDCNPIEKDGSLLTYFISVNIIAAVFNFGTVSRIDTLCVKYSTMVVDNDRD